MSRSILTGAFAVLVFGLAGGCGRPGNDGTAIGPDEVITEFLEAVRTADDKKANDLLTPLARKKTAELEMVVAPPGSDTARFHVGSVQIQVDRARVQSDWTDLDSDGRPHTDQIVWLLRKVGDGWRIAGMATEVFADQPPIELDFEDPADMVRKQQQAEEEIARRDRIKAAQQQDGMAR